MSKLINYASKNPEAVVIALAVVGVGAWIALKGFDGFAKFLTQSAVNAAGGAVSGAVVGVGGLAGIPETSQTQCEIDLAAGKTWAASFSCPVKDFVGSLF